MTSLGAPVAVVETHPIWSKAASVKMKLPPEKYAVCRSPSAWAAGGGGGSQQRRSRQKRRTPAENVAPAPLCVDRGRGSRGSRGLRWTLMKSAHP